MNVNHDYYKSCRQIIITGNWYNFDIYGKMPRLTLVPTPLSVKERSNQQQENRCKESTDHSPCHISCPKTGIPWLVLHCSFLNSPSMHFQRTYCKRTHVSFWTNIRPKPLNKLVSHCSPYLCLKYIRRHYFHFASRCPLPKNQHQDRKPSYCRDTVHDTKEKEKEKH